MFSEKHNFSTTQLVKPTFSPMSKNTFFKKKVSFFVLGNFRWNHYLSSVSWFTLFWGPNFLWPKQIVCTKMRVFLPSWHKWCQAIFAKNPVFFDFSHFWMTTLKHYFYRLFGPFPFFLFLFLFLQHKKKNKNAIIFSKTSFLTSSNFCKNTVLAQCGTICVFKHAQKHYKNGGKNENLDQF